MSGKKAERKKRVPLGVPRQRLQVEGRKGYKRRWINDVEGRVDRAIEGSYSLVQRDDVEFKDKDVVNRNESLNNSVCKTVNKDGTKAYLMEIPITLYNSDQVEKQGEIDKTEDALRVGVDAHGKPGADGRYVPKGGIKIQR